MDGTLIGVLAALILGALAAILGRKKGPSKHEREAQDALLGERKKQARETYEREVGHINDAVDRDLVAGPEHLRAKARRIARRVLRRPRQPRRRNRDNGGKRKS